METDYKMAIEWWNGHKWDPIPASSLPKNGVVVSEDGADLALGFLYGTDSDISSIEWILSNPGAPLVKRTKAVKLVVESLTALSQHIGYGVCMAWLVSNGLKKVFAQNGYIVGPNNLANVIRRFK